METPDVLNHPTLKSSGKDSSNKQFYLAKTCRMEVFHPHLYLKGLSAFNSET